MRGMSYSELATTVTRSSWRDIDRDTLSQLIESSYRDFRHQAVPPSNSSTVTNGFGIVPWANAGV